MKAMCLVLALTVLLPAPRAAAADAPASEATESLDAIRRDQARIAAEVKAGRGAFRDMPQVQRDELLARQSALLARIEGHSSIESLDPVARVDVFNDLEWVRGVIARSEDERKVCERSRIAGSNRYQVVCMTAGERRRHAEGAKDSLRRGQMCNASREACIGG